MTILNIETSTHCCSAAITIDGVAIEYRQSTTTANHAHDLPLYIQELMAVAQRQNISFDAVALSQGPGSYTGLRIGTSTAKGICYGLNLPLIPVDTLQLLSIEALAQIQASNDDLANMYLCPMIDARRMEVYTALYDTNNVQRLTDISAVVVDANTLAEQLQHHSIYFFGDGAAKCKDIICSENAHFIEDIVPQAQHMGTLAELTDAPHLDIKQMAYFEPFYLKDFIPAPSHVKGLDK